MTQGNSFEKRKFSTKNVLASVLFLDREGNILIVKPSYKDCWHLPGGSVEADESPLEGAIRETKEELGIKVANLKFVLVNYRWAELEKDKPERLSFMFYGGVLTENQIKQIKVDGSEIVAFEFTPASSAIAMLSQSGAQRVQALQRFIPGLIKGGKLPAAQYLEEGQEV